MNKFGDFPFLVGVTSNRHAVEFVDDAGTIHTTFDNGRNLGICPEVDRFHKIEQTESEEPQLSM